VGVAHYVGIHAPNSGVNLPLTGTRQHPAPVGSPNVCEDLNTGWQGQLVCPICGRNRHDKTLPQALREALEHLH